MATYKVLQDIEAEDKLVGPFTLWQFIYLAVAGVFGYLSFISIAKNVPFLLILFLPVVLFAGFLAIPWRADQPTEVWALAKLRFFLKPRRRIWNQDGMLELVKITVPKKIERPRTNGLSQHEVRSRLSGLATMLDSRGWAVKNVNVNLSVVPQVTVSSTDRLVDANTMPIEPSNIDVRPDDDILDETTNSVAQNIKTMVDQATTKHRQQLVDYMNGSANNQSGGVQTPVAAPQPSWFSGGQTQYQAQAPEFVPSAPVAATPTAEEEALVAQLKTAAQGQDIAYSHMQTIKTPEEVEKEKKASAPPIVPQDQMTSEERAAIMNLSRDNNRSIATLEKEADEVVISLR